MTTTTTATSTTAVTTIPTTVNNNNEQKYHMNNIKEDWGMWQTVQDWTGLDWGGCIVIVILLFVIVILLFVIVIVILLYCYCHIVISYCVMSIHMTIITDNYAHRVIRTNTPIQTAQTAQSTDTKQ